MPIVTISRGSYRQGKAVAEALARRLEYACLSRDDVVAQLGVFHLPEIRLVRNLQDTFSVLERFPNGKISYINAFGAAFLPSCLNDNLVYHGLAGFHFLKGIAHVINVRIISDMDHRVAQEMEWEGISASEARLILRKDDEERRKWCMFLYGIDIWDASIYHLVLNIGQISVRDAADIIAAAVGLPAFQSTETSRMKLHNASLAAQVRGQLYEFPNVSVHTDSGNVHIGLKAPEDQHPVISAKVTSLIEGMKGVRQLKVSVAPYY